MITCGGGPRALMNPAGSAIHHDHSEKKNANSSAACPRPANPSGHSRQTKTPWSALYATKEKIATTSACVDGSRSRAMLLNHRECCLSSWHVKPRAFVLPLFCSSCLLQRRALIIRYRHKEQHQQCGGTWPRRIKRVAITHIGTPPTRKRQRRTNAAHHQIHRRC